MWEFLQVFFNVAIHGIYISFSRWRHGIQYNHSTCYLNACFCVANPEQLELRWFPQFGVGRSLHSVNALVFFLFYFVIVGLFKCLCCSNRYFSADAKSAAWVLLSHCAYWRLTSTQCYFCWHSIAVLIPSRSPSFTRQPVFICVYFHDRSTADTNYKREELRNFQWKLSWNGIVTQQTVVKETKPRTVCGKCCSSSSTTISCDLLNKAENKPDFANCTRPTNTLCTIRHSFYCIASEIEYKLCDIKNMLHCLVQDCQHASVNTGKPQE